MRLIKRLLKISVALIVVGGIAFVIALGSVDWKIKALSTTVAKQSVYTETTAVHTVVLDFDTTDVAVVFGDRLEVSYPVLYTRGGKKASKVTVYESNGRLEIRSRDIWYYQLGLNFTEEKIKLTLPTDRECSLILETDTGDISVKGDGNALKALTIEGDTGDVKIENLTVNGRLSMEVDTGDVKLSNVTAESMDIEGDTGDVDLRGNITAQAFKAEADTGDIEISGRITAQAFTIETDTGDVECEGVIDSMQINVSTDTGDVEIRLAGGRGDYSVRVKTDTGSKNIENSTGGERDLRITTDTGDIKVRFAE